MAKVFYKVSDLQFLAALSRVDKVLRYSSLTPVKLMNLEPSIEMLRKQCYGVYSRIDAVSPILNKYYKLKEEYASL